MIALSYAISKIIVYEYGKHEFLRRLADPLGLAFLRRYNSSNRYIKTIFKGRHPWNFYCRRKRQEIYRDKK
jgi:hypothetical protein